MAALLCALCAVLIAVVIVLSVKIYLLKKSAEEIRTGFAQKLAEDTNTVISLSSFDPAMQRLAEDINSQLKTLRKERLRCRQGDLELKEAITNISHDLRTPLTVICGYMELLERETLPPKAQHSLKIISDRVEALKQLTEELFQYSVITSAAQTSCAQSVSLNQILEESLAAYYEVLNQRHIVPEITIPEAPVLRRADPSFLSRIFGNILSNAAKYSDGDLQVTLHPSGEIVFANTSHALDGISVGRLFHRFFTVENGKNATGLGLSIAKTLTEQMGGTIRADYTAFRLMITVHFPK
ncbi:Sensor protein kinase walK [uncultured Ruminococcus sp.]|uniref:histidine kinase n=1 Tax=Massiliimalia timonensis TaxID=1987501 RepID=A0A8J6TP22_9FIRM|nr:HAMP domain-containing sensor histidine kinase [Massiliimalia timonensis]MBC8609699.1 HAMP domain-containing histidine kinase [Massiliimalia timonensis]SCH30080.1 Sensor protein kinase walK [uncultured Ruminococcus sp.]SCH33819.1 Sensor protein kinase walK [uncultured Clostridium sp.]